MSINYQSLEAKGFVLVLDHQRVIAFDEFLGKVALLHYQLYVAI